MQLVAADGTIYELRRSETRIGRSQSNDIAIDDPGMSRQHAIIRLASGQVMIQDMTSTNGTFVNGRRVRAAVVLQHADRIEMANTVLLVRQPGLPDPDHMPTEMMAERRADPRAIAPVDVLAGSPATSRSQAPTVRFDAPGRQQPGSADVPGSLSAAAEDMPQPGGRRALGILSIGLGLLGTTAAVTGAAIPSVGFYCVAAAVVLAVAGLIAGVLAVMRSSSRAVGVIGLAVSVINLIAIFTVVMLAISAYSSGRSLLPLP